MTATPVDGREKIAIVGGGISGLVCAHLLHDSHEVTLFEANGYAGGHTRTVDVIENGQTIGVDTGFIVYNESNYPLFTKLLNRLGVATKPSDMSLSVRCDRTKTEYNGSSLNQLFAQRSNFLRPAHCRMALDILRFFRESLRVLDEAADDLTVDEFAKAERYGDAFVERFLIPIGASLWSCPPGTFREFPIRFVVDFFHNHGMLKTSGRPEWRVVEGGSSRYVEALLPAFESRIRLSTTVSRVIRTENAVRIVTEDGTAEPFDHAILACHSDQALAMLDTPSDAEREILGSFAYEANTVTLHTDVSVLPKRRRAWGSWNYHRRADRDDGATVTYNMNRLQSLKTQETYCVTLNERDLISDDRVLGEYTYSHPIFRAGRTEAQARQGELLGANRTSFCGAYWGYGFHEDGVRSAVRVCERYGASL